MELTNLPEELLLHLLPYLDTSSSLAIASCSSIFRNLLQVPTTFRGLVMRSQRNKDQFDEMIQFAAEDSLCSESLLLILHNTVLQIFPAQTDFIITLTSLHHQESKDVSPDGFLLLSKISSNANALEVSILKIECFRFTDMLFILSLASFAQKQPTKIEELKVMYFTCQSDTEVKALCDLVASCFSWYVQTLHLEGEVGAASWAKLARVLAGSEEQLDDFHMSTEILARGRTQDLETVWIAKVLFWTVNEEDIWSMDGREEGWGRILNILKND